LTEIKKKIFRNKIDIVRVKAIAALLFSALLFVAIPLAMAHADNGSAICSSQSNPDTNIGVCINRIYVISLAAGGFIAVVLIIVAGYLYMTGGKGVETAKNIIYSVISGLVILFGAYALLFTINPDLTTFNALSLPNAPCNSPNGTLCSTSSVNLLNNNGMGTVNPAGGGTCSPVTSGDATPTALQSTCFGGNSQSASVVAQQESSGNGGASADFCTANGQHYAASWGLFQINLATTKNFTVIVNGQSQSCTSAFQGAPKSSTLISGNNYNCSVVNVPLYNSCIAAAQNDQLNITAACSLSNNGSNWGPWQNTANKCGL